MSFIAHDYSIKKIIFPFQGGVSEIRFLETKNKDYFVICTDVASKLYAMNNKALSVQILRCLEKLGINEKPNLSHTLSNNLPLKHSVYNEKFEGAKGPTTVVALEFFETFICAFTGGKSEQNKGQFMDAFKQAILTHQIIPRKGVMDQLLVYENSEEVDVHERAIYTNIKKAETFDRKHEFTKGALDFKQIQNNQLDLITTKCRYIETHQNNRLFIHTHDLSHILFQHNKFDKYISKTLKSLGVFMKSIQKFSSKDAAESKFELNLYRQNWYGQDGILIAIEWFEAFFHQMNCRLSEMEKTDKIVYVFIDVQKRITHLKNILDKIIHYNEISTNSKCPFQTVLRVKPLDSLSTENKLISPQNTTSSEEFNSPIHPKNDLLEDEDKSRKLLDFYKEMINFQICTSERNIELQRQAIELQRQENLVKKEALEINEKVFDFQQKKRKYSEIIDS